MLNKLLFLIKKNPHYLPFLGLSLLREKFFIKLFGKTGYSLFPSLVTILVTKKCNYRCEGCSSVSPLYTKKFNTNQKELSFEAVKKIIDEVAWFKPFIYLNGGEPTLRPDLIDIIKYVKQKHLVCALTTNGSLLSSLAEKLIESKLDFLSVSIDGPEKFHDQVRGVAGAFENATNGIKDLVKIKKQKQVSFPHIRLASIIYPESLENSSYIVDLGNELEVDEIGFGLLMYYPQKIQKMQNKFIEKYKTGGDQPIGLEISDTKRINFSLDKYAEFLKYTKEKSKIPIYFAYQGNHFDDYFDPQIFPSGNSNCLTPWNSLLVQPNGDLSICQGFIFGNISKEKVLKQWNSQKIRKFRRLRAKTTFPACFRCNEGQKIIFD